MPRLLLVLLVALAACRGESPPADAPPTPPEPSPRAEPPPTPFDAAEAAFDTVEPPEQVVRFPPRPAPPPRPTPRPAPPPPPGPAGSCDVRASEGFCFAFTGEGWTPAAARAQCDAAPGATFAPAACPREGRIATCTFERPSAPGREIVYTYYAPYDPALAELACPGTFARVERPGT